MKQNVQWMRRNFLSEICMAIYNPDTFSVVHRLLPKSLAQMLKCKQENVFVYEQD